MTEYTSSPDAIREYMTAKERTAWWIRNHPPVDFYSPSEPPSDRGDPEGDAQSALYDSSDGESTHSIPPKMLLKYGDGRADIPISHWHGANGDSLSRSASGSKSRAHDQQSSHRRTRSEQPVQRGAAGHIRSLDPASMRYPEEIRVLPSQSPKSAAASQYSRPRSKSQPRHGYSPPNGPAPPLPQHPPNPAPRAVYTSNPHHVQPTPMRAPQVAYSQSHPMYHGRNPYAPHPNNVPHRTRSPPSIVYAPSPHSKNNYAPPTLIHHPHGAPNTAYGQQLPNARYGHAGATPFPSAQGGLSSVNEEALRSRSKSPRAARMRRAFANAPIDTRSPSRSSEDSGSTYYVLPTQGQKVQIITPDRSMYTATSTTQSPSPPHSGTSFGFKRPFFSRFFNIAEKLASVDSSRNSSSGRRLQRRHSTGAGGRPIPIPPR